MSGTIIKRLTETFLVNLCQVGLGWFNCFSTYMDGTTNLQKIRNFYKSCPKRRGATIKSLTETSLVSLDQVGQGWFKFFIIYMEGTTNLQKLSQSCLIMP